MSLRNLMESLGDIFEADDEVLDDSTEQSAPELLKEIVGSLRELSGKIADGSVEDLASLTSDLKNISASLQELVSPGDDDFDMGPSDDEPESEFDDSDESADDEEADLEEGHGAEGMGPSFDADGTQNYENPRGQSYPEKKGFVGI